MVKNQHLTLIIPENHAGERLDQALAKLLPEYSRSQIQDWISKGTVLHQGKATKAKTKVAAGDTIEVEVQTRPPLHWAPQAIPLSIVYEDNDLIILNKSAGMIVHPGAGKNDQTLLNALLFHAPELQHLPRAGILHRIDKDTTGLLLVAKTAPALKHLSSQLKKHTLAREYQAIIAGKLISGGTVDAPIWRHPLHRKKMAIIDTGRPATTHYRILERYRAHTLLKVFLETGRTHQIRVHMAHIHHPVVGDQTYGGRLHIAKGTSAELVETLRQFKRQALHAYALGFIHPTTAEPIRFEIDLPEDMTQLIKVLRKDTQHKE